MAFTVQGFTKLAFIQYVVLFISCADFVLKSKKKWKLRTKLHLGPLSKARV